MRLLVLVGIASCVALVPQASARDVDPSRLVLMRVDVPVGFVLDRDESGLRSNARESKESRDARELVVRSGRLTGYETTWSRPGTTLDSRADVCKRPSGARILFDYVVREMRKSGIKGLRRAPAGVGGESWIYWGGEAQVSGFTLVVWRYERVLAGVVGIGLSKRLALQLARKQQRRVASALR